MPSAPIAMLVGGTGFIGRHLCECFAAAGYEVVTAGRREAPAVWPHRHVRLDVAGIAPSVTAELLAASGADVIVNATGGIWGLADEQMAAAIATPTLRLLSALTALPHPPRLVHLGSVLEYGPVPDGTVLGPGVPLRPRSGYGQAKHTATQAALAEARRGRVEAVALRIPNVIGPGAPEVSLLGRVGAQLARGEDLITLDALGAKRDYVDVRDVADAVLRAARSTLTGVAVDIGRGEAVPVRSIVELLVRVSGVPARIVERDRSSAPQGHSADLWTQVDPRPAFELLGWRARRSPAEAVAEYWHDRQILAQAFPEPTLPWFAMP